MKKVLCAMALVPMLLGAGCAGGSSSAGTSSATPAAKVSAPTVIAWALDGTCNKVIVSGPAAKSIGYPNGPTDKICISASTISKVQGGDRAKERGTAKVTLGNLVKVVDNVYEIDVLSAEDIK